MSRIPVLKTYKIFIGGQFPRTESGRYYNPQNNKGENLGNICLSSRKDVRNAVVAARKAFGGWSEKSAFNRSQILYRIAEMLEGRKNQFCDELISQDYNEINALAEVNLSIDRLVYYAGWCDKYQQILSSVNPVASSHFNFSVVEPTGVVGICIDTNSGLLALVSALAPVIAGGNSCIILAPENLPLCAISFAEVINSSDVPGGVVNILSGYHKETLPTLSTHMDINAVAYLGADREIFKKIQLDAVENLKRVRMYDLNWNESIGQDLNFISDFQEIKTTWHPVENIGGASSNY